MGVVASILIGVGIYELIEHRHEIKTRCTPHATTNDVKRNEGSEVHVSSEKTQNLKRSRIPHLRPEKRAKREEEKDGFESTEHGKDIAPPEKAKKKKRSFIPRLRTSKPNANAGLERVDSSADNKNVDSLTGSQLRDTSEDAPVCGPPPPYTPPLPTGMLVEN